MTNDENNLKFKLKASELVDTWKNFCHSHTELYELTCDEYLYLLESDIEKLELALEDKNKLLEHIAVLDSHRKELITDLSKLVDSDLDKFDLLNECLIKNNASAEGKQLAGYNALLLDIISKIQEQNKKNQIFLNKAIMSLNDLKQNFSGKKNYKTYGANGVTKTNTTP